MFSGSTIAVVGSVLAPPERHHFLPNRSFAIADHRHVAVARSANRNVPHRWPRSIAGAGTGDRDSCVDGRVGFRRTKLTVPYIFVDNNEYWHGFIYETVETITKRQ